MLNALGLLTLIGLSVLSTMTLAGEGPLWVRYVGGGTIMLILISILGSIVSMSTKIDNFFEFLSRINPEDDEETVFEAKPDDAPREDAEESQSSWRN